MTAYAGGAFYYFKYIKSNDTAKGSPDFSGFDFDEDRDDTDDTEDDTQSRNTERRFFMQLVIAKKSGVVMSIAAVIGADEERTAI